MIIPPTSIARTAAALSLTALAAAAAHTTPTSAANAASAMPAPPAASRPLKLADFADQIGARDVSNTDDGTVDGHVFGRAIALDTEGVYVALGARTFPGYRTLEFRLGVADTAAPPETSALVVQADGLTIMRVTVSLHQPARLVDVPLAGHKTITLTAHTPDHSIDDLVVGDPALLR